MITEKTLQEGLDLAKRMDEISINKKQQNKQAAIDALDGKDDNIKTFAILTAQNPMGDKSGNSDNRKLNAELVDLLKRGNFAWQPVRGKYGTTEDSKIVFNITVQECKWLCLKFLQESFIYGRKENGKTFFDLYVINADSTDYNLIETHEGYESMSAGVNDYYTAIDKDHKFTVPFDYFNEACEYFNSKVNEAKAKSGKYRDNYDKHLAETLAEGKTGYHYFLNRSLIYGGMFKD